MRGMHITTLLAGLVLLTGCPQSEDTDELETVPEAPTRTPVEEGSPQFEEDEDTLASDTAEPGTAANAGEEGHEQEHEYDS